MGDENRYMQIMLNFLSNALKFTKDFGKIKVLVLLQEIHQLKNESLIQRKDEHIGSVSNDNKAKEQYAKFQI